MARIRTVKPEAFRSPTTRRLSIPARYVLIGLLTESDDEGRFVASAKALAGALFPHDEDVTPSRFEKWLQEIASVGTIELYSVDDVRYGWFPKWTDHQKVSHATLSRLPNPSGTNLDSSQNGSALNREREQGTGNREQGTGKAASAAAFESFWSVFPRKVGKRKAEAAFVQALRRDTAVEIIAGARRYRDDRHRSDEFTAHPTTWLNRDGWNDDPLPTPHRKSEATLDRMAREAMEEINAKQRGKGARVRPAGELPG